jgi:PAS domain S-box-containing protein
MENKKRQADIWELAEKFPILFEKFPQGILILDDHWHVILANRMTYKLLGYSGQVLLGKNIKQLIAAENQIQLEKKLKRKSVKNICQIGPVSILKEDGSFLKAAIELVSLKIHGIIRSIVFLKEILGHEEISRALTESESSFKNIVQSSPMGIFIYILKKDNALVFSGFNPAANRILGVDCAMFVGKTIEEAFPPLAKTEVPRRYRAAARKNIPWHTEQVLYQDQKITGAYEVYAFQTKANHMAAMFLDITSRKQLEEQLKLTQFTVDNTADSILWMNNKGKIIYANKVTSAILGYSYDELLQMDFSKINSIVQAGHWTHIWKKLKNTPLLRLEALSLKKDGQRFPVDVIFNYVCFAEKEFCCAFIRDITEIKKAEDVLKNSHQFLEKEVKARTAQLKKTNLELIEVTGQLVQSGKLAALGELTAGVAHELNQPLNGILITSQSLQLDIRKERLQLNQLNDKLESINKQVNKMAKIIQHMKIFTRQTYGTAYKEINIKDVIAGAFTFIERQMVDNRIKITKNYNQVPLNIYADEVEIEQVFLNLLSNARHALIKSEKDEKQLEITVKSIKDTAIVTIADNGIGIPESVISSIFDPFFTTKEPGMGTGLGLSVSRKIIQEHRGKIEVESKVNQFTKFTITLPKYSKSRQEKKHE